MGKIKIPAPNKHIGKMAALPPLKICVERQVCRPLESVPLPPLANMLERYMNMADSAQRKTLNTNLLIIKLFFVMKRHLLLLITAVLFSVASAFAQGGTTGPLTWNISGGTLTIAVTSGGTGAMPDYEFGNTPWGVYYASINSVILNKYWYLGF